MGGGATRLDMYLCVVGTGEAGESKPTCFGEVKLTRVHSSLIRTNISIDPSRMKHLLEYHSESPSSERYQKRVGLPRCEWPITSFKTSYVKLDGLAVLREVVIGRREGQPI